MTANITDVDEFTDPVVVPSDGEAATNASILLYVQKLSNRTRYLRNRLLKLAGMYTDGTVQIDICNGVGSLGAVAWVWSDTQWVSVGNAQYVTIPIQAADLPSGATLTGYSVRVNPGIARATTGNRVQTAVYKVSAAGASSLVTSSDTYDDGTTTDQAVAKTGLTEVIDRSLYSYYLRVTSGSDGASNIDAFSAASITRTMP